MSKGAHRLRRARRVSLSEGLWRTAAIEGNKEGEDAGAPGPEVVPGTGDAGTEATRARAATREAAVETGGAAAAVLLAGPTTAVLTLQVVGNGVRAIHSLHSRICSWAPLVWCMSWTVSRAPARAAAVPPHALHTTCRVFWWCFMRLRMRGPARTGHCCPVCTSDSASALASCSACEGARAAHACCLRVVALLRASDGGIARRAPLGGVAALL